MSFSVIVPAYNRADLIGETIKAILGQTLAPTEVIVVDDGSTDDTPQVLAGFGEAITAVRIDNSGELVARNTGIARATSEYVAFCDSDDLWCPDHLASLHRFWQIEPALNAVYANFRIVRDGVWEDRTKFDDAPDGFFSDLITWEHGYISKDSLFRRLLDFAPFFPSAMAARRQFMNSIGGWDVRVNRWMSMDFATAMRVCDSFPIGISTRPTVGIRKHAGNFSADVQKMNLGDAEILEFLIDTLPAAKLDEAVVRKSIERRRKQALEIAFGRRDFQAVRDIAGRIGSDRLTFRMRAKYLVSSLPAFLSGPLSSMLLQAGSVKAKLRGR